MKRKCHFQIQALLKYGPKGFQAAMSPMGFALEVTDRLHKPFNILARVWFDDDRILQQNDSGERTGFDHLLIGYQDEKEFWLTFWVATPQGLPVGIAFGTHRKTWLSAAYAKKEFIRKLTLPEVDDIFQYVFDHPEEIPIGIVRYPQP